jgi:hypothetical protein
MERTRLFPVIVLLSLVTVEYGGWALLGFPGPEAIASAIRTARTLTTAAVGG